ncbi:MAG: hypothetical protein HY746_04810 [Elusimicrobia bacterium]|nr:hypothetical protein [Elusimicrobiota bacterium]
MFNFFRLRIINTLLFLLVGVLVGYIIKDRWSAGKNLETGFYDKISTGKRQSPDLRVETAGKADLSGEPSGAAGTAENPQSPQPSSDVFDDDTYVMPVMEEKITSGAAKEDETAPGEEAPLPAQEQNDFFTQPHKYKGKEVGVKLQMILAKKTGAQWKINLMHIDEQKNVAYVYIDDDFVLAAAPDLKIGYFYSVRFRCAKGSLESGNTLLSIIPTGDKASWATGVSAVE